MTDKFIERRKDALRLERLLQFAYLIQAQTYQVLWQNDPQKFCKDIESVLAADAAQKSQAAQNAGKVKTTCILSADGRVQTNISQVEFDQLVRDAMAYRALYDPESAE